MITIPNRQTKAVRQPNISKFLGDLWASFNLDLFSNRGVIKLSPRLRINTSAQSNQGLSVAFKTFDQRIFTIAGTRIFKNTGYSLLSGFVEDASTGILTTFSADYSDMELFNDELCAITTGKLISKAADGSGTGAWTDRYTISSASSFHKTCWSPKFNRLYFVDGFNQINSVDTSWSVATSGSYYMNLPFRYGAIYTIAADDSSIWIATLNPSPSGIVESSTGASILKWDGITSSTITSEYKVKAKGVLALCKDDRGVMHAIDSNGALLAFNGSSFEEIARLPLSKEYLYNALGSSTLKYDAFIHPNGFYFSRNGTFILLVNNLVGDSGSTIKENLQSGIWEYHKDTGFVHRQSLTYTDLNSAAVTDYGQNRVSRVGALVEANYYSTSAGGQPSLLCGATYYTNASSTASGIFVDDPLDAVQKYGYFVTTWIQASALKDTWQKVYARFRQFLNSDDKFVLKYRTREASPTEISITWVDTTSFTTTTNILGKEGYEVEVIQGTGSGKCSHITLISVTGGTYTATVDETYTGVTTGTAKARLQAWTRAGSFTNQTDESCSFSMIKESERIQLKFCMQFTGEDELHELALINKGHESMV